MIAGPLPWQRLERGSFGLDALGGSGVLAADDLVNEAAIADEAVEVGRAAHQQRVADGSLEMTVRAFDRAVLMRDTAVVARRLHPVMGAQHVITPSQILARIRIQVAECCRQTVAAVFERRATKDPQRFAAPRRAPHSFRR